jgi:hypothetical protein
MSVRDAPWPGAGCGLRAAGCGPDDRDRHRCVVLCRAAELARVLSSIAGEMYGCPVGPGSRSFRGMDERISCPVCADVIGVYESAIVLGTRLRRSSLASEPSLRTSPSVVLHEACAIGCPDVNDTEPVTDARNPQPSKPIQHVNTTQHAND